MDTFPHRRPFLRVIGFLFFGLVLLVALGPRPKLAPYTAPKIELPKDLDAWLTERESHFPLRPQTAKTILWALPEKTPTPYSFVYLHGFSASRREIQPVVEQVADHFHSNAFFTRLTGHGMTGFELGEAEVHEWFDDAEEAMALGKQIGQKVIVVGTSTGAALSLWLGNRHPEIAALILISPNFAPKDRRAGILLWPWGLDLIKLLVAKERAWKPKSQLQAEIWTYRYPIAAAIPMALLSHHVLTMDLGQIQIPTLAFFTEQDPTINAALIPKIFSTLGSPKKKLLPIDTLEHVLAGSATSPENVPRVVHSMTSFVEGL